MSPRDAIAEAFLEAQRKAGEPLSPWTSEGFAVIAEAAVTAWEAEPSDEEVAAAQTARWQAQVDGEKRPGQIRAALIAAAFVRAQGDKT